MQIPVQRRVLKTALNVQLFYRAFMPENRREIVEKQLAENRIITII